MSIAAHAQAPAWNVLTDCWLEAMTLGGHLRTCSPMEALKEAAGIRCICAASSLDLFAAQRFLLTLLYWKANAAGGVDSVRKSLLDGHVPEALQAAVAAEHASFQLFNDAAPFLQDPSVGAARGKSAGSLFAEFSCGVNIAHFHHGDDANMRLCMACATVGMLRVVPWTQSGGAGMSPAVHGAPPIMAMACGGDLARTMGLNLVALRCEQGQPRWSGHFAPTDPNAEIPYLEALTWNPRRVNLGTPVGSGKCWRCGRRGVPVVGPIAFAKNENTKSNKSGRKTLPFAWQDPSAFYVSDAPHKTLKSQDENSAALGVDLAPLAGQSDSRPDCVVVDANPEHQDWLLVVPCAKGDNKTYDHRRLALRGHLPDAVRDTLPVVPYPQRGGLDGWRQPTVLSARRGSSVFVRTAVQLFGHTDWAVLAAAAYRDMQHAPGAFELFSGLYWSLRGRRVAGLPSRKVAWLVLKLMAVVPTRWRIPPKGGGFCPLLSLPRRQIDERRGSRLRPSSYPVSLPGRHRLEAALRNALEQHLRKRAKSAIDWAGLCTRLGNLLY